MFTLIFSFFFLTEILCCVYMCARINSMKEVFHWEELASPCHCSLDVCGD